jgi:hypothetical protein
MLHWLIITILLPTAPITMTRVQKEVDERQLEVEQIQHLRRPGGHRGGPGEEYIPHSPSFLPPV